MSMYARLVDNTYQTPVLTFAHPDTGRRVTLAGMMHHGEPGYFEQMADHIEKAAGGGVVLAEGGKLDPARLSIDPDGQEVVTVDLLRRMTELGQRRFEEVFGWTHQTAALSSQPGWVVCDLDPLEIVARRGHPQVQAMARKGIRFLCWRPGSTLRPNLFAMLIRVQMQTSASDKPRAQRRVLEGKGDDVLLDQAGPAVAEPATVRDACRSWRHASKARRSAGRWSWS
jgi:hypothetical protein